MTKEEAKEQLLLDLFTYKEVKLHLESVLYNPELDRSSNYKFVLSAAGGSMRMNGDFLMSDSTWSEDHFLYFYGQGPGSSFVAGKDWVVYCLKVEKVKLTDPQ